MSGQQIFIVAGEMSGDTHGSGLMNELKQLRPDLNFYGLGGPLMAAEGGADVVDWLAEAAVVGLAEVLPKISYFKKKQAECLEAIAKGKHDAVVLVDYPGFNLRLATAIRQAGLKTRIIYYISPQVWAWKKGRIKTMARDLDLMLCIFPFEQPLYTASGLRTLFTGHPMVDRVHTLKGGGQREPGLVGWFPGSRKMEIKRHFPVMLKAAALLRKEVPGVRFVVSAANEERAAEMRSIATNLHMEEAHDWIETGTVYELMQRAEVGAVASGTATLEAACFGLPYALIYRVAWPTYFVGKMLVSIQHLGIINVLAERTVVKELVQHEFNPPALAAEMKSLLTDASRRQELQQELAEVVATLGDGGAYRRAADAVLETL